jgi:hypothetical protein
VADSIFAFCRCPCDPRCWPSFQGDLGVVSREPGLQTRGETHRPTHTFTYLRSSFFVIYWDFYFILYLFYFHFCTTVLYFSEFYAEFLAFHTRARSDLFFFH